MVYKSFNTSSSIKSSHKLIRFFIVAGLLTFSLLVLFNYGMHTFLNPKNNNNEETPLSNIDVASGENSEEISAKPSRIDFQPIINDFVNSTGGKKGLLVYDLDRDEMVGSYNTNETFSTASLYKLFVVYEGYRRVEAGEWNAEEKVGATSHTILECLDLSIRESNSYCAESLWNMIGREELNRIIDADFDIYNTNVSNLISTPEDILSIMKLFYTHSDVKSVELITVMKDSFLNQPATNYNWRQGLPSGFSQANVYNKVGWDYNPETLSWTIYNDAAIIEFPEDNRHFIAVVMTNNIPYEKISEFGDNLEKLYFSSNQS